MGSSRSPASTLRALESPKYPSSKSGMKSKPVSARKLAATLWEMNEVPSPLPSPVVKDEKRTRERERVARDKHYGSLPPHLSDPSHTSVSERSDRSGTGSRQRRTSSISQMLRLKDHNAGKSDSIGSASLMEMETRSHAQTPSASSPTVGARTRLKDVSNALMTSKELLKIINRIWGHENPPSSSMSLISALHAELERARLQVNQLIQQRLDESDINYLMKCFAEEKAAWKSKEQESIEAAIESIAGELEIERKLRRRFESLNKKLGRELAETKAYLLKTVKELESEKRTRVMMDQVCDKLARDIGEDKVEAEEMKRESVKVREEVEKEREMLQLADVLREERVQMKLMEAKYQLEEKNAAVDELRNELEAILRTKKGKEKGSGSKNRMNDTDVAAYLNKTRFGSHQNKEDYGEVEDAEDIAESDLHSIELNMDNNNKSYMWTPSRDSRKVPVHEEEIKRKMSTPGRPPRRSTSIQRSVSNGVESLQGEGLDWGRFFEDEKRAPREGYEDEVQKYKLVKGIKDRILSNSRAGSEKAFASPTRQWGQPWPLRDSKPRLVESQNARRSIH